jgi:hypothetical protein
MVQGMNYQHQQHKQRGSLAINLFNSEGALSKVPQRKYSSRNQLGVTCYSLVDDQRAGYTQRHSLGEIDAINM